MACKMFNNNNFPGRVRSILLFLCLVLLPSLGWSFAGGTGTVDDPYLVQTAEHLNEVRNYLSSHFRQIADIDLTSFLSPGGAGYNNGTGWEPIGSYYDYYQLIPFTGTYDGDGYLISNLFFDHTDMVDYYVGLFGFINETAVLSNITLENVDVTGFSVGPLVGYCNGNIYNCSSSGIVSGHRGGGLIATMSSVSYYSTADISDSHSTCDVTTTSHAAGLIYLVDNVHMVNCYATGNIVSDYGIAAGLVGGADTYSIIENCYATGYVTGATAAGGLICTSNYLTLRESYATGNVYLFDTNEYSWAAGGLIASGENTLISDCYATGDVLVTGDLMAGGLAGYIGLNYEIQNSYSTGRVTSDYPAGGFVGYSYGTVSVENSFWDIYTSGRVLGIYGEGLPTPELLQQATFTGWDFDEIWQIDENSSYPYLRTTVTVEIPIPPDRANDLGALTVLAPELILTENSNTINVIVYNMGTVPQSNFPVILIQEGVGDLGIIQVTETIGQYEQIEVEFIWNPSESGMTTLWGVVEIPGGDEYEPNNSSVPVTVRVYKDFDGGEGTIDAPYLISEAEQFLLLKYFMDAHYLITEDINMGFFAGEGGWSTLGYYIDENLNLPFNGRIDGQNHVLSNLSLTYPAMSSLINGFIAYLGPEGAIENLIIDNVNVYGYTLIVGALVGRNEGEIRNSAVNSLFGEYLSYYAGFVGENHGLIEDCQATIESFNLHPFVRVGGLVVSNFGTISGSEATVHFRDGGYRIGGLVVDNYETGVISGSSSTGKINNPNIAGGLVGYNYGEISNSFSSCQIIDGLENIGGLAGSNFNLIESCYATGSVSGEYRVAGLVGRNEGTISNSYSHGNIMGYEMVGGLVGLSSSNGHIQYCYSVGSILGFDDTGGLIGINHGDVINSYWDTQTSGQNNSQGGEGRTTEQMMQQDTYEDWDFEEIWAIIENESYPYLQYQDDPVSVDDELLEIPVVTKLIGNYPNPFNPDTIIVFSLSEPGIVNLDIFNIKGQKVRELADQLYDRGEYRIKWDGRDDRGSYVSSGIYFYRLRTDSSSFIRKMMLLK